MGTRRRPWIASSLVFVCGEKASAHLKTDRDRCSHHRSTVVAGGGSGVDVTFSSTGMMKAPVLPVPFFALARISRPPRATGIASSCKVQRGGGFVSKLHSDANEQAATDASGGR